jgi:uracil-DNA glycosylase family 4
MDDSPFIELTKECNKCKDCPLWKNGSSTPISFHNAQYVAMYEGWINYKQAKHFWDVAEEYGLKYEQFMHTNTVNCYTEQSKRHKKRVIPPKIHRDECRKWVTKFVTLQKPKKMLAFGNIVMEELTGEFQGITKHNGKVIAPKYGNYVVPTVLCISPLAMKYQRDGEKMVRQALQIFKEIPNER